MCVELKPAPFTIPVYLKKQTNNEQAKCITKTLKKEINKTTIFKVYFSVQAVQSETRTEFDAAGLRAQETAWDGLT